MPGVRSGPRLDSAAACDCIAVVYGFGFRSRNREGESFSREGCIVGAGPALARASLRDWCGDVAAVNPCHCWPETTNPARALSRGRSVTSNWPATLVRSRLKSSPVVTLLELFSHVHPRLKVAFRRSISRMLAGASSARPKPRWYVPNGWAGAVALLEAHRVRFRSSSKY